MVQFALLLLIVMLIILLIFKSNVSSKFNALEHELKQIKKYLAQQSLQPTEKPAYKDKPQQQQVFQPVPVIPPLAPKPIIIPPPPPAEEPEKTTSDDAYFDSGFKVTNEPAPSFRKEDWLPKEPKPAAEVYTTPPPIIEPETVYTQAVNIPTQPPAPPKPGFFERNPDLEKFVGENLVSKIGIAILVLAIGYFVKYAIDNDWIGPVGRVAIGIFFGGILVGIAHRLRLNYQAFSSVLVGGGLAIFYFTITLAHQQFNLFHSQAIAFVIMLVITAFAVLLSLLYNRQELAVIALVGGFASPFLVSNGSGNYVALFTYLIILNTGLLIIAYRKAWRVLNTTAFAFTVILFATWIINIKPSEAPVVYTNGFLFAGIFYLLFLCINIAHNIKEKKQFIAFDFGILLSNTCLFFSAGLYFLSMMNATEYNGLFSAIMGVFNLGITYFLFRRNAVDKNILYLLIGITLTFVSLTAPLQLHGHFITIFWASEAVLLYWLFTKSKISIVQYASAIVYVAMLVSLLIDWENVYGAYNLDVAGKPAAILPVIFNKGFITTLYAALASYTLFRIVLKQEDTKSFIPIPAYKVVMLGLLYAAGFLELEYQFTHRFNIGDIQFLYLQLYTILFVLALGYIGKKSKHIQISTRVQTLLLLACAVLYLVFLPVTFSLQQTFFTKEFSGFSSLFIAHWVVVLLTGLVLYRLVKIVQATNPSPVNLVWFVSAGIVFYLSIELYLLINNLFLNGTNGDDVDRVFIKVILPVLWGLCSFVFMWFGMKHKYKTIRIVSLSLFALTLVKLFAYDISNIPVAGKIAAFFCLGVLLLIISFMYQRLKKIIIEDEAKPRT